MQFVKRRSTRMASAPTRPEMDCSMVNRQVIIANAQSLVRANRRRAIRSAEVFHRITFKVSAVVEIDVVADEVDRPVAEGKISAPGVFAAETLGAGVVVSR